MKKEYIMHHGKISNCPSNVSEMSIFEYVKLIDKFSPFKEWWTGLIKALGYLFGGFVYLLFGTLIIIFMPVVYWIRAHRSIKRAKEFVKAHVPK